MPPSLLCALQGGGSNINGALNFITLHPPPAPAPGCCAGKGGCCSGWVGGRACFRVAFEGQRTERTSGPK